MAHGRSTSRSATHRGPCTSAVIMLLAVTLLHAMLSLGASQAPPSDLGHCASSAPAPAPPRADDDGPTAPRPAALTAREADGHPSGHAGHGGHVGRTCAASAGALRSLPTPPGPPVVAAVRGRLADPGSCPGTSGTGGEPSTVLLSSRTVVLRC